MRRGLLLAFAAALALALAPTQALAATGSIAGTLTDASNAEPIPNTRVCALKTTGGLEDKCATTSVGGGYVISLLPPGTYRVQFAPTYSNSDYLMRFYNEEPNFETADFVTVTSGATTTGIDAQLQEGGRIEGTVIDASTKTPIEGIEVCARRATNDQTIRCTSSDGDGIYEISGLPTDSYKLSFYAPSESLNYIEQFYKGKSSFASANSIAVTAGVRVTNINAEMQAGGQVEGTVTDAATETGIEGVGVCVYESETNEVFECAQTDAAGDYKISRLRTGSFKVGFLPQFNNLNYAAQFYNDQTSLDTAQTIPLVVGEVAAGVDAELLKGAQIAGTAIDAVSEDPIPGLDVCAYRDGEEESERCTSTDIDGEYAIVGLGAGDYKVGFSSINYEEGPNGPNYMTQYYNGKPSLQTAEAISVATGSETTGIDAEMLEGARIKGTVIDAESKETIRGLTVCAFEIGETAPERCSNTNSDGEYGITALPSDEYDVEFFEEFEPTYISQYYDGESSLAQADAVSVTAGFDTTGIDAEMQEGGRIEGLVTESSAGDPVLDLIKVCALTVDDDPVGCTWTYFEGKYSIPGLAGGQYKVVFSPGPDEGFFEDGFETRYYDEKESLAEATPVSVSVAMPTTGIDATLTRTPGELAPESSAAPSLTGAATVGGTLSCSQGSWENSPTEYAYTWLRDGNPIGGQISSTYTVQSTDQGHSIACEVTATNENGSASAQSNVLSVPSAHPGDQGTAGGGGGDSGGGGGAAAIPTPPPGVVKPLKCKKGFRKKTVHGKARCVKRHKHRRAT